MESSSSSSQSQSTHTNPNNNPISTPPTQNTNSPTARSSRRSRYSTLILSTFRFLQAPLSTILSHYSPVTPLNPDPNDDVSQVSIHIVPGQERNQTDHELGLAHLSKSAAEINSIQDDRNYVSTSSSNDNSNSISNSVSAARDDDSPTHSQQHYDIQQAAKLVEQIVPFSLLLLLVFIRQHWQDLTSGFVGLLLEKNLGIFR